MGAREMRALRRASAISCSSEALIALLWAYEQRDCLKGGCCWCLGLCMPSTVFLSNGCDLASWGWRCLGRKIMTSEYSRSMVSLVPSSQLFKYRALKYIIIIDSRDEPGNVGVEVCP